MKKLIKQGAKLAHVIIDMLAEEIAGKPLKKEKKRKNGNKKDSKNRISGGNGANQHLYKKEVKVE